VLQAASSPSQLFLRPGRRPLLSRARSSSARRCVPSSRLLPATGFSHSILVGIDAVEADEFDPRPFVDTILEDPAVSPEATSGPVDDAEPESCAGVAGERNPAGLETGAELPALRDEVDVELLAVFDG
jgi:hypothetical protein